MRLTLVISSLSIGGAERVTSILANYWADHNHDVCILTFDSGARPPAYALDARIQHSALNLGRDSLHVLAAIRNNVGRVIKLRAAIRKTKPDLIISFVDQTNILVLLATVGTDFPVIVSEAIDPGSHPISPPWGWLRKRLYKRAAALHAPTNVILSRFAPSIQSRGFVIPYPALPCEAVEERLEKTTVRSVLSVGRLVPQKGFDLLLQAFARISEKYPYWVLTILGDGPLRGDLEAQRDRLGLADRVKLPGAASNLTPYLQKADVFVMASRYEGFPMVLCQAMACGLPVIYTDCPSGPREIIRNGVDGLLVPNEDVEGLAAAMEGLISDEKERDRLAMHAKEIIERFNLPTIMELWEARLTKIVSRK
jgi:glycosyltransferase involved in cell wall biosynthesis